jgi:predicted AAA+ superfamily ATPase
MLSEISDIEIIKRIKDDNPWWSTGQIPQDYGRMKRRLYFDLLYSLTKPIENKRAVVLMGPRRVGKTVLLNHVIQQLIMDGIPPAKIMFLSIDAPIYNRVPLARLFALAMEGAGTADTEGCYVIFDEIQYLKDWEIHLKSLVDTYRSTKFVVSGSAAAALKLKSNESGAGRFTDFILPPLTFQEFLHLQDRSGIMRPQSMQWGASEIQVYGTDDIQTLNDLFLAYVNMGGYPEAIFNPMVDQDPGRFIKNDIVDKVLLRDLPSLYGIIDIQELNSLFNTVAYNTAHEFSLDTLSKSSHVQKPTISKYLEYLEAAFLIKRVHRIDMAGKAFKRANFFKIYLTNPSLRRALFSPVGPEDQAIGDLVETAIMAQWMHRNAAVYYARWQKEKAIGQDGEVDIVLMNQFLKPGAAVECKWSDRYASNLSELKSLSTFLDNHNLPNAVVTSRTVTMDCVVGNATLHFIPAACYAYTVGANSLLLKQTEFPL